MLNHYPDLALTFVCGVNKFPFRKTLMYNRCHNKKMLTVYVCVRLWKLNCDDLSGVKISVHSSASETHCMLPCLNPGDCSTGVSRLYNKRSVRENSKREKPTQITLETPQCQWALVCDAVRLQLLSTRSVCPQSLLLSTKILVVLTN